MGLYISFEISTHRLGVALMIAEEYKHDLVGYGYKQPPLLRGLIIHLAIVQIVIGKLYSFDNGTYS